MGRGQGGLGPIILTGTFNLVGGHALHSLLFGSMCSFRLDRAWKLFIYCFNKEKLLEINALGKLKMLFQRPWISGRACPGTAPSSLPCLRRSWLLNEMKLLYNTILVQTLQTLRILLTLSHLRVLLALRETFLKLTKYEIQGVPKVRSSTL